MWSGWRGRDESAADVGEQPNGNLLRYRLDRIEHRAKNIEQAMQFIAEKGAKCNEQIKVHDERFRDQQREIDEMRDTVGRVPVLEERVGTLLDGFKDAKRALWAAAGSFLVLAATIVWQAAG